jgi:hypothetical protein
MLTSAVDECVIQFELSIDSVGSDVEFIEMSSPTNRIIYARMCVSYSISTRGDNIIQQTTLSVQEIVIFLRPLSTICNLTTACERLPTVLVTYCNDVNVFKLEIQLLEFQQFVVLIKLLRPSVKYLSQLLNDL